MTRLFRSKSAQPSPTRPKQTSFISIHANSSADHAARGVETYYLNFSSSPEAMEVAARENATAQGGVHNLQDMIQQIARNEKIEESKELAADIQGSLTKRLQRTNHAIRDRGVRKAPFVVLIGANMPSILAEISFISNSSRRAAPEKAGESPERGGWSLPWRGILPAKHQQPYPEPGASQNDARHSPRKFEASGNQR